MQFHLLREVPAGSGRFEMTGEVLSLDAGAAAAACAARQAAEGCRYGLWPYSSLVVPPAAPEPPAAADDEISDRA